MYTLQYEGPHGMAAELSLAYTNDRVAVVKAIEVTAALALVHNSVMRGMSAPRRFARFGEQHALLRSLDLEGFRELAARAAPTPANRAFLSWCEGDLVSFLDGGYPTPAVLEPSNPVVPPAPDPTSPFDVFLFEGYNVRAIKGRDGEPWWLATDICHILGLGNSREATSRLDPDQRDTVRLAEGKAGNPNRTVINFSGLNSLVLTSYKPKARHFKKWITSVVIPALHRKGTYSLPGVLPDDAGYDDPMVKMLQATLANRLAQVALERGQLALERGQDEIRGDVRAVEARLEREVADSRARAAEAEAREAEAKARARELELRIAESNATAARAHADAIRATQEADRAVTTVTGEAGFYCLVPWARKHGIFLPPPKDGQEGKVCKALCDTDGITPGTIRQARYDVHTYPEHVLQLWLQGYKMRQPGPSGPTLFNGTD